MPGTGKYTNYAIPSNDKNTFLNKLFRSTDKVLVPITQDLVGKENEVREAIVKLGQEYLIPNVQNADPQQFPGGKVDFNFTSSPIISDTKWTKPGDAANPYTPDLTSPGPGKTGPLDRQKDPEIAISDVKKDYLPGAPDTGTIAPATTAKVIADNKLLGKNGVLGKSSST